METMVPTVERERLQEFLGVMMPEMNEVQRRHLLAALSEMLGRGSASSLSEITGVSTVTISRGKKEIRDSARDPRARPSPADPGRVREEGAGRRSALEEHPGLDSVLESLLDGTDRGSPLTWTTMSTRDLSNALKARGFPASHVTVSRMLGEMGFTLRNPRRRRRVGDPDFDEQFAFISDQARVFMYLGCPVISMDLKRRIAEVDADDAVRDIGSAEGYSDTGICEGNAGLAANSIRSWWSEVGSREYPDAKMIMVAVNGQVDDVRWREELQAIADATGLAVFISHIPPGTFRWNRVDHRMFDFIGMSRTGEETECHRIEISLVGCCEPVGGGGRI